MSMRSLVIASAMASMLAQPQILTYDRASPERKAKEPRSERRAQVKAARKAAKKNRK